MAYTKIFNKLLKLRNLVLLIQYNWDDILQGLFWQQFVYRCMDRTGLIRAALVYQLINAAYVKTAYFIITGPMVPVVVVSVDRRFRRDPLAEHTEQSSADGSHRVTSQWMNISTLASEAMNLNESIENWPLPEAPFWWMVNVSYVLISSSSPQ